MSLRLRAAVANLREHAIVQQMRARCAETTVKKLEGDVAKLNAALFSARTNLISVLSDPVQTTGTGAVVGAGFGMLLETHIIISTT